MCKLCENFALVKNLTFSCRVDNTNSYLVFHMSLSYDYPFLPFYNQVTIANVEGKITSRNQLFMLKAIYYTFNLRYPM